MKLNLLLDNEKGQLNSYVNIDPFALDEKTDTDIRIKGDITPLDWIVDNGECDEIIARHILCYFPMSVVGQTVASWLKKIKKNGTIVIAETDIALIAEAFTWNKLTINQTQKILYGDQNKSWNIKKSGLTIQSVNDFLEGSGFKIIKRRFHDYNFTIVAKRMI